MLFIFITLLISLSVLLPVDCGDRKDISKLQLTSIGEFGLMRRDREGIPAHFHTGIDIKRPSNNYLNEPIFAIAEGKVISKRTDGPYAQVIIEHYQKGILFWSLYEHIAGIAVNVGELVTPHQPIARYMNSDELNRFGWQFDHFHLEILKVPPIKLQPEAKHPERLFNSYSLICFTTQDLEKYYYNPLEFLKSYQ
jgi:murein DD-endopeptidase MepM/ murein hydrolase activator NlpD